VEAEASTFKANVGGANVVLTQHVTNAMTIVHSFKRSKFQTFKRSSLRSSFQVQMLKNVHVLLI